MRLSFFLLLLFCKVLAASSTRPPHFDDDEDLIAEEFKPFNLTCRGSNPLRWKPEIVEDQVNIIDRIQNDTYVSTLKFLDPLSSDTGYYYCHYIGATDFKNDKENVDTTYVFVSSEWSDFVNHHLEQIKLVVSETLEIKCITTHPDIHVSLFHNKKDISNKEWVKHNPKKGFMKENVQESDEGTYSCETNNEDVRVTVKIEKKTLGQPNIEHGKNQHLVQGEMFSLQCSVVNNDHGNLTFTWRYPNKEATYAQDCVIEPRNNDTYYKSNLVVPNASEADSGLYTCTIKSEDGSQNSRNKSITVHENMKPYVNITSSNKIQTTEGQLASWKAYVNSYPKHNKIIYTNWRGKVLNDTERISITFDDDAQSWLKIKNISSSDFGNYTLTVTTDRAAENSTTALFEVESIPHMEVDGVPQFVGKWESLNVSCLAQGFPRANVSLLFQNCTSTSSCSSSSFIKTINEETDFDPGNIVKETVQFSSNTSGKLLCHAENNRGVRNKTAVIRISDIDGIFVLRHSGQNGNITDVGDHRKSITVVENDNFSLMCGGTKFDYKRVELVSSSKSGSPLKDDSEFSWKMKISAIKSSTTLAGNYTCTAYPHEEGKQIKSIIITVAREEKVYFEKEANMIYQNQTKEVKGDDPFTINCNVTGTPAPTIQWMKDNKNLTTKSEPFDENSMHFSNYSKVLNFKYVVKKHTGVYTCIAKNRLNEVMGSLTLTTSEVHPGMSTTVKLSLAIAFVGIAVLVFVVVFLMNRVKKEQRIRKSFKVLTTDLLGKGNIHSLNPASTADKQADMLPYDKVKWEMPRENITLGKQLGSGTFGRVIKADVTGLEGPSITTVAIKMCKNDVDASQMHALVSELKVMIHLGKHLNIVNLMGASTVELSAGELWILVEYCRFGNLLEFMQRHRRKFTNQICPVTGKINRHLVPPPMSPALSEGYPPTPALHEDGYLSPSGPGFVLSDPPPGHSARTDSASTMLTSSSRSSIPHLLTGQFANNPMYSMKMNASTEDPKEELEGSEDCRESRNLLRKGSRLLSIGSIALSDSSSVSHPLKSLDTITTSLTQQPSFHSPLSPTDTYFIGEDYSSLILEMGSVPGVTAPFSTTDLICWGWQMAQGMNYLSGRKILHGDLAARNLLLHHNNVVKISDFGLSRNMYRNDNYVKKRDDLLPIKWMSIEAIKDRIFSIESDVWAFGITLWEIFSLGSTPYAGMEINNDFVEQLENGYRMSCPKYANQEIYTIMKQCWEECPLERPSFSQLVDHLGDMISDLTEEYLSQNETYMQMNKERFSEETDYLSMMANPNFESKTMPDEPGGYVYIPDQTMNSNSIRMESLDTVTYPDARSPPSSPLESTYLPMGSVKSQSPSDVFSPHPSEPSSNPESSRLTSPPEEGKNTLLEPEESSGNSTLTRQSPKEGNLSKQSKNELLGEEKSRVDPNYVNL